VRSIRHAYYIALNEVKGFITDRLAFGMFILFPFLFIVMFTILLGNAGSSDKRIELHLATQEQTGISLSLIQSLASSDESKLKPGDPLIIWDKDYSQSVALVQSNKLDGLLLFHSDFTNNVMSGRQASLEVITQSGAIDKRMALQGLASAIRSDIGRTSVEVRAIQQLLAQQGKSQDEIQQAVVSVIDGQGTPTSGKPLLSYVTESVGDVKPLKSSSYVVPGFLVMFVFFAAAVGSISIIQARQNHTLERLLAGSVRRESILGGFFLGGFFRGLLQMAIFWTVGLTVFRIDIGVSPVAVIGLSLIFVVMSASFSLLLATIAKSERGASGLGVLCSLVLAPLGGSWWPLFIVPPWMQFLARLTPHGWANDGFDKLMLFGATGGDVMVNILAITGFAVVFAGLAVVRFKTDPV
jgi:ABC-2 type transport system permease protein